MEYQLKGQLEGAKVQTQMMDKQSDMAFRKSLESDKEKAKDERVKKQAIEQSKLIAQRKGERGELEEQGGGIVDLLNS